MSDNSVYVVKCRADNFEDVQCMLQIFVQVLDIDPVNFCIRTFSLDSTIKQRLGDIGASFWQEVGYSPARAVAGRKF